MMENNNFPLITIITISYNAVSSIEETILSVINQNFDNFEYIVVDGGSTDGTLDVIKKYQDKIDYYVSEPDKGIYDAMNKGINLANGEWINFMNSGDSFYNYDIFKTIFSVNRSSDIIYGDNMLKYKWGMILLAPDDLNKTTEYMVFGHQTVFMKRNLLLKFLFDCRYKISADYDLFYRVYTSGYEFEYIEECISLFSADDGISTNNPLLTFMEDSKINGFSKSKLWKLYLMKYKTRLLVRNIALFLLPNKYIEKTIRKNIIQNRLVKNVILNEK